MRIPVFGGIRQYAEHPNIWIGWSFGPPCLRLVVPQLVRLDIIAHHLDVARQTEESVGTDVRECQAYVGRGLSSLSLYCVKVQKGGPSDGVDLPSRCGHRFWGGRARGRPEIMQAGSPGPCVDPAWQEPGQRKPRFQETRAWLTKPRQWRRRGADIRTRERVIGDEESLANV